MINNIKKPPSTLSEIPTASPEKYSIIDQQRSKLCLLLCEKAIGPLRASREQIPSDLIILDEQQTEFVVFDSFYSKPILHILSSISDKTLKKETKKQISSSITEKKGDERILEQALESFPRELEAMAMDFTSELEASVENIEIDATDIECSIPEVETIEEEGWSSPSYTILTGRTIPLAIELDSLDLKNNLILAEKINKYVTKKIPLSFNHFERFFNKKNITDRVIKSLYETRFVQFFNAADAAGASLNERHLMALQFFNAGNCGHLCMTALHAIKNMNVGETVEPFSIKPGNHCFLVIGRELTGNPNPADYHSWGEKAVICDPWSGGYYPATLLEKYLMDCKGLAKFNSREHRVCVVANFNLETQELKLVSHL